MGKVDNVIKKAVNFLSASQDRETHLWTDFKTKHHGQSSSRVTSIVCNSLVTIIDDENKLMNVAEAIVREYQANDLGTGFGYNRKVIADADSTSWAYICLSRFEAGGMNIYEHILSEMARFIRNHQDPETGGIATYNENDLREYMRKTYPKSFEDISAWCSPAAGVTAAALRALGREDSALEYLLGEQRKDGSYRSYWWNSDIYATAQAAIALEINGKKDEAQRAKQWLVNNPGREPFYQALCLIALLEGKGFSPQIDALAKDLANSQLDDGSWGSYPVLMFPDPDNHAPWKNRKRWRDDAADQKSIVTTALCAESLALYDKR